ncbi:MAG: hypothetical protein HY894_06645 [Deltaproteobacteria bacterium]|nr:hypothetical protein [Deltaproteobacteria bacterium]
MMIFHLMRLIAAIAVFLISGGALAAVADGDDALGLGRGVRLAVSFALGLGGVSLQMFLYSLVSIPFGFLTVAAPWAAALAAIKIISARRKTADKKPSYIPLPRYHAWDWALILIAASQPAYALFSSFLLPVSGYDAWAISSVR